MNCKILVFLLGLFFSASICGDEELSATVTAPETASPSTGFQEIGSFQVTRAVLTQLGKTTEIDKGDLVLRVFNDGIDIRISPVGQDQDYLAFQIYRSGGVADPGGKDSLPGVQAFSDQGEVVRHLVINSKLLTLTKFPTLTSDVEIVYATRL